MNVPALVAQLVTMVEKKYNEMRYECGIHTIFMPINNEVGARLYRDKAAAQVSCSAQKMAERMGIGPKVFSTVYPITFLSVRIRHEYQKRIDVYGNEVDDFSKPNTEVIHMELVTLWFYLTEIVQIAADVDYDKRANLRDELDQIVMKLDAVGYKASDLHSYNWGMNKDGKAVLIDYSDAVWEYEGNKYRRRMHTEFYKLEAV